MGNDITAIEARAEAQRLVFSPFVFQGLRALVSLGLLERVLEKGAEGILLETLIEESKPLSPYAVKLLVDIGAACRVLAVSDDRATCTKVGWFLVRDEMTRVNLRFTHSVCYKALYHLEEALVTGKPAGLKELGDWSTVYEGLSELPEEAKKDWFAFDHYYSDHAFEQALPHVFEHKPSRMLDIGGNTGKFALSCARFDPNVHMTICDLPGQLRQAMANAEAAGLSDRVSGCPVNLLRDDASLPAGHDTAWMSQFLCCFSEEEIIRILCRVKEAVGSEGRVFILDTLWERQRYAAASFSLIATSLYFTAVANGNSRMYRYEDLQRCIEKAGLEIVDVKDNIGLGHTLLSCRPRKDIAK